MSGRSYKKQLRRKTKPTTTIPHCIPKFCLGCREREKLSLNRKKYCWSTPRYLLLCYWATEQLVLKTEWCTLSSLQQTMSRSKPFHRRIQKFRLTTTWNYQPCLKSRDLGLPTIFFFASFYQSPWRTTHISSTSFVSTHLLDCWHADIVELKFQLLKTHTFWDRAVFNQVQHLEEQELHH